MNISAKIGMGIIIMMLSPFFVQAQLLDPVSFTVADAPEQVQAGEIFDITVDTEIEGQWHLYSVNNDPDAGPYPTKFSAANDNISIAGNIAESEPVIEYDPNFEVELGWHTQQATFTIPVAYKKDVSGNSAITLEVLYQVCDDKSCLPPKTKTISHNITVAGTAANPYEGSTPDESKTQLQENEQSVVATGSIGNKGIFGFLWLALTAGFAALLTPCVYPMIPLTVSFFSKKEHEEREKASTSAFIFGGVVILVFTMLGVILSLLMGASGAVQFAANPWVNLAIAFILIVFSLSLLGAFEIQLPYQFTNWLNRQSNENSGVLGIVFMALTISAVSFACTVPFVSGLLAALSSGEWFYPIIGMMAFSAAFASPFVLLALFPQWLESLPKSGSWMNVVKVLLGFIELAAAFKFLSNADLVWEWGLISRPFTIAAWIAIFLMAGLYALGIFAMKYEQKPKTIGTGRLLLALPFLLFSFYLIPGLMGASLGIWDSWLPPKQATDVSVVYSISQRGSANQNIQSEKWSDNFDASLAHAAESGKPVFIDFTGYTCTNCRAMESNVFPLQPVQDHFEKMELVRLYTDDGTDGRTNQKFQFKLTGTVALPTYVIMNPDTEQVIAQLVGYTQKEKFQHFLEQGLTKFNEARPAISAL